MNGKKSLFKSMALWNSIIQYGVPIIGILLLVLIGIIRMWTAN